MPEWLKDRNKVILFKEMPKEKKNMQTKTKENTKEMTKEKRKQTKMKKQGMYAEMEWKTFRDGVEDIKAEKQQKHTEFPSFIRELLNKRPETEKDARLD